MNRTKEIKAIDILLVLVLIGTSCANASDSHQSTESYSNGTDPLLSNHSQPNINASSSSENITEYEGRSAKSLAELFSSDGDSDGGREPRIINDKEFSIKGFIPIVGFNNDKHDSEEPSKPTQNFDSYGSAQDFYPEYNQKRFAQSTQNVQKHAPQPEDQRFIGAALQGLASSLGGRPKPLRKQGFDSSNAFNSLSPNDGCVCVPFYMCKNGYLSEAKNSVLKSPNIETAQSIIKQFAIPAPLPMTHIRPKPKPKQPSHQNPYEQYLPIDERSNDDLLADGNEQVISTQVNNSAPQYADEVLARMLGVRSDGCGVLRTCCRPNPMAIDIPDFQPYGYPPQIPNFGNDFNKRFTAPNRPNLQQFAGYGKPQKPSYDYDSAYSQRPIEAFPSQIVQSGYGFASKPLNPIDSYDDFIPQQPYQPNFQSQQIPVPMKSNFPTSYPSIQPLRPLSPYKPQPSPHSLDGISSVSGYGVCGRRHAVGIHGRVQNLQYHESSTEFGEFPWQVAILKRLGPADSLYVCGGALISPNFVVTAAHCLKKFTPQDLKVRLGEWDVHREDEFYPYVEKYIDEIIVHPEFFPGNLLNDLALVKLESPIDVAHSPHIAPICLPDPHENFAGHRCFVSGWGKNAFGHQGEFQSVLTKVDVPVVSHGECERALKRTRLGFGYRLHPSMVCAGGEPGKDACEGDGGSGLVCDMGGVWKVVGLVSWGVGCGQPGVPGVYTNLAHLRPWIDSYVMRYSPVSPIGPIDNFEPGYGAISERSNAKSDNNTLVDQQITREETDSSDSNDSTTTEKAN